MKLRYIALALIMLSSMIVNVGCDTIARADDTPQAKTAVTESATEPKIQCKVQIQSYDKQSLTDEVTYTIKKINLKGYDSLIAKNMNTNRGLLEINLDAGEYLITADSGNYSETISINEDETSLVLTAENNSMYNILSSTEKICFIGDSITIGTVTDGEGWYSGLLGKFPNIKKVDVSAIGGQTSASLFEDEDNMKIIEESEATTYVIALGINDVIYRYKEEKATTYTAGEYVHNMEKLVRIINNKDDNIDHNFIFIAPFEYANKYTHTFSKYIQRENTHSEYTSELYNWCTINNYTFVAPMNYVNNTFATVDDLEEYMVDDVHPAYPSGTSLYSKAVYESSVLNSTGTLNISQTFYKEVERKKTASSYKKYPIDYIQEDVSADIKKDTFFTIKDHITGKYVSLEKDVIDGEYKFEKLTNEPHYYHPTKDDGTFTVNHIPQGGYIINFEYNNQDYSPYIYSRIVFVNGGDIESNKHLYMKAKSESDD